MNRFLNKIIQKQIKNDEETRERLLKLTNEKDYGLCSPPMDAQVALNELCRYFLGEDWYTALPESQEQVNTEIVYEIETRYKGKR